MGDHNEIDIAENHLFIGRWKTSNSSRLTTITANPLDRSRVFRISCLELVDTDVIRFQFLVDDKSIIAPLNEGGSVFIEGKSVFIEQTEDGVNKLSSWEVVQEPQLAYEQVTWVVHPQEGSQSLIAAFEKEQEFVLGMSSGSINCSNGSMIVIIDGKEVRDKNNKIMQFLEGSNLIGKGKTITVAVSGNCAPKSYFSGYIKINKTLVSKVS